MDNALWLSVSRRCPGRESHCRGPGSDWTLHFGCWYLVAVLAERVTDWTLLFGCRYLVAVLAERVSQDSSNSLRQPAWTLPFGCRYLVAVLAAPQLILAPHILSLYLVAVLAAPRGAGGGWRQAAEELRSLPRISCRSRRRRRRSCDPCPAYLVARSAGGGGATAANGGRAGAGGGAAGSDAARGARAQGTLNRVGLRTPVVVGGGGRGEAGSAAARGDQGVEAVSVVSAAWILV